MTAIEDLFAAVSAGTLTIDALSAKLQSMDLKLDDIAARIQALINGGGATPEQLNALLALVSTMNEKASAADVKAGENLAEADALDGQE